MKSESELETIVVVLSLGWKASVWRASASRWKELGGSEAWAFRALGLAQVGRNH